MAQIDQLLGSIARFGAMGAVLASDEKVMLSFPDGPRYASQTTPHATLVRLVEEILPAGVDMQSDGGATFSYRNGGGPVVVRVEADPLRWKVTIQNAASDPPTAAGPAPCSARFRSRSGRLTSSACPRRSSTSVP